MDNRKVKIESTVKHTVVVSLPDMRFSRKFNRELQSTYMNYDVIEEALQRQGFRNMIKNGTLRIVDKQDRIDLGLEDPDDEGINEIIALTTKEMLDLMRAEDLTEFKSVAKKANKDVLDKFVLAAVNSKITDPRVAKVLNKEMKKFAEKTPKLEKLLAQVNLLELDIDEDEDEEE